MTQVLVSDKLAQEGMDILKDAGFEVVYKPGMSKEELMQEIKTAEALIVRSATKPDKEIMDAAEKLKVIVRAGAGTDNIDKAYAKEKGIIVENTPGQNSNAVAELTVGLMLSLARFIPKADKTMKEGKWEKKKLQGTELTGKTVGIVGLGKIGRLVIKRLQGFEMKLIGFDPMVSKEQAAELNVELCSLEKVFKRADYVSLHLPLNDKTRNLVSNDQFKMMKKTAYLLNVARGGIVDEEALYDALKAGEIAGAALDVYSKEPLAEDSKLRELDNLILTPHLGASSKEAQINCAVAAAHQIIAYFKEGKELNRVN
jgi:D-3-phosphoglycerate dehydrogenase